MIARRFFALCEWIVALGGCGDDKQSVDASQVFDSGQGTNSQSFCQDYCTTLVEVAPGCEQYNENHRCEKICKYYVASVCSEPYEAFASCLQQSKKGQCFQPDAGRLTLVVDACHEPYQRWQTCIQEKNASVCPY
jgi:hypothetical protein